MAPWRWLGIPMLQALMATILLTIPLRAFGIGLPEPVFAMPVVFAWAVIRPSVLAPFLVVVTGLACDLIWGASLGFWATCLLLAYGLALSARSIVAGQAQVVLWGWYGLVTASALGTGYLITMLNAKMTANLVTLLWQFLATIVLYPLAHRLIERFEDADVRFR